MNSKTDHPRVCGEKALVWGTFPAHRGSPPRVRGEADLPGAYLCEQRITPACAGRRKPEYAATMDD